MSRILPILFNTEMVQAILSGRKTVTRRTLKHPLDVHSNELIYNPGDILYVRETWAEWTDGYLYKAWNEPFPQPGQSSVMNWHPSIHMPKEAARIWLKVKDVRVERLHNMKLNDFLSEGIEIRPEAFNDPENAYGQAREMFKKIWNSTIKKSDMNLYGWDANPWVWVIEFERCEKPEDV